MNGDINFIAAFGHADKQVSLSYVSGVVHPTYKIYINKKEVGTVSYVKLTLGGRPEVWRCHWNEKYVNIFTTDDCQILIEIASQHFEKYRNMF